MTQRIYLDHAATSPLRPEAKAAMDEGFCIWANPSSPHAEGRKAKAALEDARERIKKALGWDGELIFTSGASEALWIALNRAKVDRRIVSAVEHDAVFRAAPDAEVVPIAEMMARPDETALDQALGKSGRALVAVQAVNSETGTELIQNLTKELDPVVGRVKDAGGMFLCDCSQSAGKRRIPNVDMAVISAHKLGGPIGIGALLVRDFNLLEPAGGHERGYRQGTEICQQRWVRRCARSRWPGKLGDYARPTYRFWTSVRDGDVSTVFGPQRSYIFSLANRTMSAQSLLIRLDAMGFAVSAGSACSSGTLKKSRVLDAFGVSDEVAARTIRVSIGWNTTPEDLEKFAEAWKSLS